MNSINFSELTQFHLNAVENYKQQKFVKVEIKSENKIIKRVETSEIMSFLTHINRYDDFNYNEDFEESIANQTSDGEGSDIYFTSHSSISFHYFAFFVALILCFSLFRF